MSTKSFGHDKDLGEAAERTWLTYLRSLDVDRGHDIDYEMSQGRFPDWDIMDWSRNISYEVKYDSISQRTGNFYFEYYNPRRGKDAGLMTSKATYLIYLSRVFKKGELFFYADIFKMDVLKTHLVNNGSSLYEAKMPRQKFQRSRASEATSWGAPMEDGVKNALGYCAPIVRVRENKKTTGWIKGLKIVRDIADPILIEG